MRGKLTIVLAIVCCSVVCCVTANAAGLQCGAAAVDVTPRLLPVIRNGGFLQATDDKILDPLYARSIVLDDGTERVAIVVVDSCMIPTDLCDAAKQLAVKATGIPADRIMISATHTHSAPSVMEFCLGAGADGPYRAFLPGKIAESIEKANARLQPARAGWTRIDASHFTKCRRWITRSDKLQRDPFGELTIHANMHPGHQNPDFIGPSGPVDPWLSLLMISDAKERPIAALANLSMHYFGGHPGISADYCGRYVKEFAARMQGKERKAESNRPGNAEPGFVAIMSQGTSGDLWWGDYSKPRNDKPFNDIEEFTTELVDLSMTAIEDLNYRSDVPVRMAEKRLTMDRRVPDEERLAWARRLNRLRGDRPPKDRPEVYALQAEHLHENPTDEVVLQAIRVGELGITGIPNEVYGLTGLKLKRRSPLQLTMNVSLANGATGYIPPPEQHALGGYNTWPATTAGLEVAAEPQIVDTLLSLLEIVAEAPRKSYTEPETAFSKHVLGTTPLAYWRMAEMEHTPGRDATGNGHAIRYSGLVAYHVTGRARDGFGTTHDTHALQLAGGKLVADNLALGESYSVQFSFSIGTSFDFRGRTATLVSREGDELYVSGTDSEAPGRLVFGDVTGETQLERGRWYHCVFVRNGDFLEVYLDGKRQSESARSERRKSNDVAGPSSLYLGGDRADVANLEGKLDEVAVYDRALTAEEVAGIFTASRNRVVSAEPQLNSQPLSAVDSMQRIHVRDGYRVELVAAEPMVMDPVAIDWGPDGKLWVAEMADYPMGMDGDGRPGGRIRMLEDADGDGRYDQSTLFLDGVGFPNGVMAWRDGVLVTAAPEIFFAEDTDGDGRADRRTTILSGFATGNQQLRVNGLRWGLDGFIHCASGAHHAGYEAGNSIDSLLLNRSIRLGSRDFRFHPDTGEVDPLSGPSQYGRVRDDFGNWFGVQNSQPLWHYVLEDRYMRRNSIGPATDPRRQVRVPRMPEVFSAKPPQRRFHGFDHAGHYTSACGISVYRDELLFPRDEVHAFTCEPFHNLVQHHRLKADGTSFQGDRADDGAIDFFASTDRWTRPVMSRTGPDGALWIVDMYRYMIEHPEWLPQGGKDALRAGYRAGDERGRIYRIVPVKETPRHVSNVASAELERLAELLEHPNGLVRDMAHRELLMRKPDAATVAIMTEIFRRSDLAEARLQALSVLAGLGRVDQELIRTATRDEHAAVRRMAALLAEPLSAEQAAACGVLSLVEDSDATVRLQLANSLGFWSSDAATATLHRMARRADNDEHMNAAIASSIPSHFAALVERSSDKDSITRMAAPIVDLLLLIGEERPAELVVLLNSQLAAHRGRPTVARMNVISRWFDSLSDRAETLDSLVDKYEQLAEVRQPLNDFIQSTRELCGDSLETSEVRTAAIRLLGRLPKDQQADVELLAELASTDASMRVRDAALKRLTRMSHPRAAAALVEGWSQYLPRQQKIVANALLSRSESSMLLLDALAAGRIATNELTPSHRQRLMSSRNTIVSGRAKELLGTPGTVPSTATLQRYLNSTFAGNASNGEQVFRANCSVCHSLDRGKIPVGPDVRSLTNRSKQALLTAILTPDVNVDPKFFSYSVVLKNGESLVGIITSEAENSVTLRDATGMSRTVLRSAIEFVQRSKKSLMPGGFEQKLSPRQMADLLAFVQDL